MDKLSKETLADIIGKNMREAVAAEIQRDEARAQLEVYRNSLADMVLYCNGCDGDGFINIFHRDEGIDYHYEKIPCKRCAEARSLLNGKC